MRNRKLILYTTLGLLAAAPLAAQSYHFPVPSDDRWFYPFNFTPGFRPTASCFGLVSLPGFNQRDGAIIIAWDTSGQIPTGLALDQYPVAQVRMILTHTNNPRPVWPIDLTVDEWYTYDPNAPGDDADPGRPIELFGVGFGPTRNELTWNEFSPFIGGANAYDPNDPIGSIRRDPYPFVFDPNADPNRAQVHVEDNVREKFTPTPWAIGAPLGYDPNDLNQQPFEVVFDVDLSLSQGMVREYFQRQLSNGRVFLYVTCLRETTMFGDAAEFPNFFMKEGGPPGRLEIVFGSAVPGDADGDGCVGIADLLLVLSNFGGGPAGDVDGDGEVGIADLLLVLSNFGSGSCP